MRIRRAHPGDIVALARIAAASYRAAFAHIIGPRALAARDAGFFARRFRRQRRRLRLASIAGRPVGFSMATRRHLDMLFVDPRFAGRGAGRRLLAECERRGVRTLECFAANHAARRFYEGAGWRLERAYARRFAGATHDFVAYERPA
ncbi:MAG: GNAT family N-acetyltransferase [Alphaproteobacteria bacterium]